jgi:hypothetical protein
MLKKRSKWKPEPVDDGDKISCPICNGSHTLFQGSIHGVRVGDGVLFYKCGSHIYMGAINKYTAFGVKLNGIR